MTLIAENLRLAELVAVTKANKPVFDDFLTFISGRGYRSLKEFIDEPISEIGQDTILQYLKRPYPQGIELLDGIARPYQADKAKFFFLAWLLRDAPAQRLQPIVSSMSGNSLSERRARLLNLVRIHVSTILDSDAYWHWEPVAEVIADRLEGSRRAIKGTLFEEIVRRTLSEVFSEHQLNLTIGAVEIRLEGETFDVSVTGPSSTILLPVKTRETMGGGHALLFTRDIHKSITAARNAGFECIPVIIAESWAGDLAALGCRHCIHIDLNPNQVKLIEPILKARIEETIDDFISLAG